MKAQLLLTTILLLSCGVSMAQGYQTQQPQRQPQKEVTTAERAKSFIDRIAPKMDLTKGQKDSLTTIFTQFIDDVEKYRAENNGKVIIYMQKIRDDKVKALLRNETKYNKYLDIMDDIKNQRNPQQNPEQQRPSGPPPNGGSGSRGPS